MEGGREEGGKEGREEIEKEGGKKDSIYSS